MKIESLLLITGNEGKAKEFEALLNLPNLHVSFLPLPLVEIQSLDIGEVGRYKTKEALRFKDKIKNYDAVLTDDTGLTLKAKEGLPSVPRKYSSYTNFNNNLSVGNCFAYFFLAFRG